MVYCPDCVFFPEDCKPEPEEYRWPCELFEPRPKEEIPKKEEKKE
jgi:hypothetical protein